MEGTDSIQVVLDPGEQHLPVVMRGAWAGDSIVGVWSLEPTGRGLGGGGTGTFVMRPHRESPHRGG